MGNLSGVNGALDITEIPVLASNASNSSGNKANANAVATLAGVAGVTNYVTGVQASAAGATAGLPVLLTITGCVGGTITQIFTFPAGALVGALPFVLTFFPALQATGPNVAIVATLPAGGAGNTNAAVSIQGFTF